MGHLGKKAMMAAGPQTQNPNIASLVHQKSLRVAHDPYLYGQPGFEIRK